MRALQVLIAERDEEVLQACRKIFEGEGFNVFLARNVEDAKDALATGLVDLAILSIRLLNRNDPSDKSGLELARTTAPNVPKIIYTAEATIDLVREALLPGLGPAPPAIGFVLHNEGLEALLTAVVKALPHAGNGEPGEFESHAPTKLGNDHAWLDLAQRSVYVQELGEQRPLSQTEYLFLKYFFQHPNETITRERITKEVFREEPTNKVQEADRQNSLVSRIRQKIEPDPAKPRFLVTVRGHGFMLYL